MIAVRIAVLTLAAFASLFAAARAATEYCPATLAPLDSGAVPSRSFAYRLEASSRRSVQATLIADTDRGWFSWKSGRIALSTAFFQASGAGTTGGNLVAVSPELAVYFPSAVSVRRAWVTSAQAFGDEVFGWDADGNVRCDAPDFENAYPGDVVVQTLAPEAVATRPQAWAKPARAPFTQPSCDRPFAGVRLTHAAEPNVPPDALGSFARHAFFARVAVAVDALGKVTETWTVSGSGFPALDRAAERAAAASTYAPAISYCRNTRGLIYLQASFNSAGAQLTAV
ncbi:MAG: hypothetical protein JO199_13845 [Candidatus Eremiobacteraeota bacterium]|nr:hypothetical protein [Candidatus Eremiobacteraeota bacterium]